MSPPRRFLLWILLVLALFTIIFLRAPNVLLLPALQVEDGSYIFAHFYQHRGFEQLFRFQDNYVHLTSNIIAYCSVRLPTRLIPYGITWAPLFLTVATYALFFNTRYRRFVPSDTCRGVTCVLFALAPISSFHHLSHTDYSHWTTLLLLILLSVRPLPDKPWQRYVSWAICNLLIWGSPLAILVLPLPIYFICIRERDRLLYTTLLVNLIAHHFLGVEGASIFAGLNVLGIARTIAESSLYTLYIIARTAFRTAFGSPLLAWADRHIWSLPVYWALFLVLTTSVLFRIKRRPRTPILFLLYIIYGVTFLTVIGRGYENVDMDDAPRYVYIQSLAFLVLFVILATEITRLTVRRLRGTRTRTALRLRWGDTQAFVLAALIGYYFLLNTQLGYYLAANTTVGGPYRYSDPQNGRIVRDFFDELATIEDKTGTRSGICLVAEKKDDWSIVIDTRSKTFARSGGPLSYGPTRPTTCLKVNSHGVTRVNAPEQ